MTGNRWERTAKRRKGGALWGERREEYSSGSQEAEAMFATQLVTFLVSHFPENPGIVGEGILMH